MMTLNIRGKLRSWERPVVMGIINVTPDSFYAGSRISSEKVAAKAIEMKDSGCDIIDIGGYSSRPGAAEVGEEEEIARLVPAIRAIRECCGNDMPISVDTFRSRTADVCLSEGADIINDISGGDLDPLMPATVARLKAPYIVMHMRGTPADMQTFTDYDDVTSEVLRSLAAKADRLHGLGIADIIIDPGFGFAKTTEQNYRLMAELRAFKTLGCPVLAGISRKSMICKVLNVSPQDALNGTTALNMAALMNGADILRVHDVKEAAETVKIYQAIIRNTSDSARLIMEQTKGDVRKTMMI